MGYSFAGRFARGGVLVTCIMCKRPGHSAVVGPVLLPKDVAFYRGSRALMCPMRGAVPWGEVIDPTPDRRCGRCGWANFRYGEMSLSGIRGYRCVGCGAIKAENRVEVTP